MDKRIKAKCANDLYYVKGNEPKKWNHHIHMHLELGELNINQ